MDKVKFNKEAVWESIGQIISQYKDPKQALMRIAIYLNENIAYYDWVGFYLFDPRTRELVLGPFVGAPTDHTRIAIGKGVCGQVAQNKKTMIVQDVAQMDNYLSCSVNVKSEIVVPIIKEGCFVAEIDIDSHALAPFGKEDQQLLEKVAEKIAVLFG